MQHNGILTVGKAACAVVLSCLLATSPLLDGAASVQAYAVDTGGGTVKQSSAEDSEASDAPQPAPDESKHTNEVVPLVPSASSDGEAPEQDAAQKPSSGESGAGTNASGATGSSGKAPATPTPTVDRVTTDVELSTPEGDVPAKAGTVIVDGVKYTVNPDGGTAKVTGWYGTAAPKGDVVLAEKVVSGADEYRVTSIADKAFENCDEIESLTLPDSLETVGEGAFKGCAKLQRIDAGERNATFVTHDGMLFTKDLATLLVCPEGKQGVAQLPESMTAFEPAAFAACRNVAAFQVPETNAAFAAIDGVLYTSDRTRLLLTPANTVAATIAPETTVIAAGAFAECANLSTIVSNAVIQQIEPGAFALNAITNAVVALAAGENYDALKAVWEQAGFSHFTEPAKPGEIQQPAPQQSGFMFQLLDDYTLAVSWAGEADPEANLVIPATAQMNGTEYKVSTIAAGGFQGRDSLSSVQIRAPITTIGDNAFAGCAGLASIELAEGITSIGAGAFSGTAVESAAIPASVSFVGAGAFANCTSLSRILTFSNAADVAGDALNGCTGVSIYTPYEASGTYPWNPGLVVSGNHILPYGVSFSTEPLSVEVGETADLFEGGICEVPEGCELSYAYAATPISVEAGQVTGKKAGTSEVNAVLSMDGVELDRSVRVVEVTNAPEEPLAISADIALLSDEPGIMPLSTPDGARPTVNGVAIEESWSKYDILSSSGYMIWMNSYYVGTNMYVEAASDVSVLTGAINIPTGLSRTGDFYKVKAVLDGGFQNLTSVTSVTFVVPARGINISQIGRYAFAGCTSLQSITFPDTITNIYAHAFDGDTSLKSIAIPPKVTTIEDSTFLNCTSLSSVTIPEGVTTIGPNAFKGCTNLKSITLPSTLTSIAAGAFQDTGLTSVTIPASVTSIDPTAFGSSTSTSTFSSFSVNASNATYKSVDGVLYNKAGNTLVAFPAAKGSSFSIPAAVTTIGPNAFKNSKLTSIILPATVSSVGASSFAGSVSLKEVLCLRGTNDALTVANCFTSSPTVYCDSKKASAFSGSGAGSVKSFGAALSATSLSLVLGQTASSTLTASSDLLNSSAFKSSTSIAWSSSDTTVATVSPATGASTTVTGKKSGSATVTAQLKYGTQVLASSTCATSVSQTYTVHFNGNNAPGSMADQTFVYGTAQNLSPNTFKRDGYTFVGWATNSEGTGTLYTDKQSVNNLTSTPGETVNLWAKWTPKQYQATFITNGGSTVNPVTADFGATFAKPADPTKEGYAFAGWYKEEQLQNVWDFTKDTMPLNGVKLYAKWNVSSFAFSLGSATGIDTSGSTQSGNIAFGTEVKLKATAKPGYEFAGWTSSDTSLVANQPNATATFTMPAGALTMTPTAKTIDYTITFHLNEGTADNLPASYTVESADITLPTPTRDGYTFAGWFENEGTTGDAVAKLPKGSYGHKTYWAKWEAKTFTVTFDSQCGSEVLPVTVKANQPVAQPATNPTRLGWTFGGWCTDVLGTLPYDFDTPVTKDITLYASWSRMSISDTFGTCAWEIDNQGTLKIHAGTLGEFPRRPAEAQAPWYPYRDSITAVEIDPGVKSATSLIGMFYGLAKVTRIDGLTNLDTSAADNMGWMFRNCASLQTVDLTAFNTSQVTSFSNMFSGCNALTQIKGLPNLDTSNVALTCAMFAHCQNLTSLDLSRFDSSSLEIMSEMFFDCPKLTSLDLSSFSTGKMAEMNNVFLNCVNLTSVTLPDNFVNPTATTVSMFAGCPKLQVIPENLTLPSADLSGVFTVSGVEGKLPTYYAGTDPNVRNYNWDADGRVLENGNVTVTFKADNGQADATTQAPLGGKAVRPADPTKDGLTFAGWYKDEALTQIWRFATDAVAGDTTLYAKWVTYDIAYEYPANSGQYVYYDILSSNTVRTAAGKLRVFSPNDHVVGAVEIPETVVDDAGASYTVVEIGDMSFGNSTVDPTWANQAMTSVALPDTIEVIGDRGFQNCDALVSLNIPSSTQSIGYLAIFACDALTNASAFIPASVINIDGSSCGFGSGAPFGQCPLISSVEVDPANPVFASQDGVVYSKNMNDLIMYPMGKTDASYTIPNTVTHIGQYAVTNNWLESVHIPSSVVMIEEYAFDMSRSLKSVSLPDSIMLASTQRSIFTQNSSLESVELGAGISLIPASTFNHCTSLRSVTAYGNVTSIFREPEHGAGSAFEGVDKSLITINLPGGIVDGKNFDERKAVWVAAGFLDANVVQLAETTKVVVTFDTQGGSYIAPQTAEGGLTASKPEAPTLDGKAFAGWYSDAACTKGNEWDFATWVTESTTLYAKWVTVETFRANAESGQELKFEPLSVPQGEQHGTVKLVENEVKPTGDLVIPATVQDKNGLLYDVVEIARKAILETEIESLTIPNTVTTMRNLAVQRNYQMKSVSLPASLKTMDNQAISECTAIESIFVDPENPYFFSDNNIVMYTKDMKKLVLAAPMSLEESFTIPSTVEEIQGRAFFNSPRLVSVHIPTSVKTLGDSVFSGCPLLENIEADVANSWFRSVDGVLYTRDMKTLIAVPGATKGTFAIPTGVTTIRDGAMTGCAVTGVTIPSTVTTIEPWAFQDSDITALVLPESITNIGLGILACPNLKTVVALGNVTKIEGTAFMRPGELTNALDLSDLDIYLPDGTVGGADFNTRAAVWKSSKAVNVNRMVEDDAATGLTYTMQNDFTLSVRATNAAAPAAGLVLPATRTLSGGVNTYPVSVVEQNAFKGSSQLKELTLPATITTLGASAFEGTGLAGTDGKLHVFGDLSAEGINEGTEVTGTGSFKGLDKSKVAVDFAASVSAESKALWTERKFATSAQTFVAATFDTRGGSAIAPQRLAANQKITQPDTPTKGDLMFVGWFADSELTTAWNFDTPISADTTLYAKWKYGEGQLPTMLNGAEGTDASWEIAEDGTLAIKCDKPGVQIKPLFEQPTDVNAYPQEGHWSPLRDKVKRVVMEPGITLVGQGEAPANMDYWFAGMHNLTDISGLYLPDGTQRVMHALAECTSLKTVPEGLSFPDSLVDMDGMFYKAAIATLPSDFRLPSKLVRSNSLFSFTNIVTLPKGFALPSTVTDAGWMFSNCKSLKFLSEDFTFSSATGTLNCLAAFQECSSLKALPDGFALPANVSDMRYLLNACSSLETLPEGFVIPGTVGYVTDGGSSTGMDFALSACPSLTTLPKGFDFPTEVANAAVNPFWCQDNTPIRYAGENESILTFNWTGQNRTLVTPVEVTFDLRGGTIDGASELQPQKVLPGDLVTRPADPVRKGYTFKGWFVNGGETEWDFNSELGDQGIFLYAGWEVSADDVFYCSVDGDELKFQVLTRDGAAGTGTVRVVRNDHGDYTNISGGLVIPETVEHEGNVYTVTEIGDKEGTSASSVFQYCTKLTSVSVPASVTVLGGNAFCDCSSLKSITFAEGSKLEIIGEGSAARTALTSIALPDSVRVIGKSAFCDATALAEVHLNEGLQRIGESAFCRTSISAADLPTTLTEIGEGAFWSCEKLTKVSIPAAVQTIGIEAFTGCSSLATIQAESAIAFLDATAFDVTTKQTARVLLPAQPANGVTFEQLATTWNLTYGFTNVIGAFGSLPTVNNANPTAADFETAGWSLTFDGLLEIHCKEGESIADFGWTYDQPECGEQYWGSYRDLVADVDTRELAGAQSMNVWFAWMNNLKDISNVKLPGDVQSLVNTFLGSGVVEIPADFVIPNSATDLQSMFNGCTSITVIPETFKLPENAQKIGYLFGKNPNLTDLPANFKIPDSVTEMAGFFNRWTSMTKVPESFAFPENCQVTNVAGMFQGCTSLVSLPDNFELPASVENTYVMFWGCSSLASLPENFKVSSTVTKFGNMFQGCTSLTSLPDNFDIPASSRTDYSLFYVDNGTLPMYYGGANENVINYVWEQAHRTLVTPSNRPDGTFAVTLNTKSEGEVGAGQTWTTMYTNTSGMLAEPTAPSRPGMVFALWYADEDCTQRVDFSRPFEADTTLYGKFVAGSRSGSLPTVAGTGSAWWSLSDEGTLYIGGAGKIKYLGWDEANFANRTDHWAPYCEDILSVSMAPSIRMTNMEYWFYGCTNLTDIEGVVIPEGIKNIGSLFWKCSSLRSLPENFNLPSSIEEAYSMFRETGIVSLPPSFVPSKNLYHVANMFFGCKNLESLPDGFVIKSDKTPIMKGMLNNCPSLQTLPSSFAIPEGTNLGKTPFYVELAEGEPRVPTYYNGSDPGVLNYDWESQNRTLISDAGDRGMFTVTYKTMDESGAWTTRTTSLTDSKGIATNPGAPLNGAYVFTGWCTDEACLNGFDFATPLAQDQVLYGKWIQHGGCGTAIGEGQLPVQSGTGEAWWQITLDGTLMIMGDGIIERIPWTWNGGTENDTHWQAYRNDVRTIAMAESVRAEEMNCWFQKMPNLTDIDGVRIPTMTTNVGCLFFSCKSLERIPSDFGSRLSAANIDKMDSVFNNCDEIKVIPESFRIPASATSAACLFQGTAITSVPEAFAQSVASSEHLTNMNAMFKNCRNLQYLPSSFAIPEVPEIAVNATELFRACTSLRSLPEGFSLPDSLRLYTVNGKMSGMDHMFDGCNNLAYLPESFDFPLDVANDSYKPFMTTAASKIETYFAGGSASESNVNKYDWTTQNRTLVTAIPEGQAMVNLYVPDGAGVYGDDPWYVQLVAKNELMAEPTAPSREGFSFVGWYTDAACATAFDFTKTVAEQITAEPYSLYAKYQENSGVLATVNGENDAKWEFTSDGTLRIHAGSSAIVGFEESARPWIAVKGEVQAVQMDADVTIEGPMEGWFAHFAKMKDPTGIFVPEGVTSVKRLFAYAGFEVLPEGFMLPENITSVERMFEGSKIKSIPDSFVLPSTTEDAYALFVNTPLERLPKDFSLPANVTRATSLFYGCKALRSVPDSFVLHKNMAIDYLFYECSSLVSLPKGFNIPEPDESMEFKGLFYKCTSLTSLPEGFDVPTNVKNVSQMFFGCTALKYLPASLDISDISSSAAGIGSIFNSGGADNIDTYYAGTDVSKLLPSGATGTANDYWLSTYKRTLYAGDSKPANSFKVTFMLQKPGEAASSEWMTVLSDASGKVADPLVAAPFGYAFMGWKDASGNKFNFDTGTVTQDTTLYGTFSLVVDVDVPLKMSFALDSSNQAQAQDAQLRSFTPVPLEITSVATTEDPVADEVFPDAATRAQVGITFSPKDGTPLELALTDTQAVSGLLVAAAKSASAPGVLDYTIGLSIPQDTLVKRYEYNRNTSIASITYQVAPKQ